MTDWMIWFCLAGAIMIFEMFTGTFYLLMLGISLVAGGLVAVAGASSALQFGAAAVVGIIATFALRRSKWGKFSKMDAVRNPNVNLDIGQTLVIDAWSGNDDYIQTTRAMYRGALWDVELETGMSPQRGTFVIREVRGSRLIVANN